MEAANKRGDTVPLRRQRSTVIACRTNDMTVANPQTTDFVQCDASYYCPIVQSVRSYLVLIQINKLKTTALLIINNYLKK